MTKTSSMKPPPAWRVHYLLAVALPPLAACVNADRARDDAIDPVRARAEKIVGQQIPRRSTPEAESVSTAAIRELLGKPIDDAAAVKIALLNQPGIQAALESLGVSSAALVRAGLLSNPVFTADAKFFTGGTEIELGIAQSFLDLFYLPQRKRIAEAGLAAAQVAVTREIVAIVFEVRGGLVEVRAADQLVTSRATALAAADAAFELMKKLHAAGNATDPELTVEETVRAQAAIALAAAESARFEAREDVNATLGLWGDDVQWTAAGALDDAPLSGLQLDRVETRSVAASLPLAENLQRLERAAREAGLASWEGWLSTGDVGVVAKRESSDGSWGLGPSGAISLPLFDQGQAGVAHAQSEIRELLWRHAAIATDVRSAARRFRERAIAAAERAAYLERTGLPVHARHVHELLQNYNAMQIGAFAVLVAKQQEVAAAADHVAALRDAWLARLDVEELLAGNLNAARLHLSAEATATNQLDRTVGGH